MGLIKKIKGLLFIKARRLKYSWLSDLRPTGHRPDLISPVLFSGNGQIIIGENVQFGYQQSPLFYSHYSYLEAREKISRIEIGNNVIINNNFSAVSNSGIEIQDNCVIGVNVSIVDSDFHHLEAEKRNDTNPPAEPVIIGKNVFIGSNVTILKGVTIGNNSVIGSGSILSKSFPDNVIVAGNPAKVVRTL